MYFFFISAQVLARHPSSIPWNSPARQNLFCLLRTEIPWINKGCRAKQTLNIAEEADFLAIEECQNAQADVINLKRS